jgi:hypothetical protein
MNSPTSIPSVSVTCAPDGSSTRPNEMGMRPMQERAYQKRGEWQGKDSATGFDEIERFVEEHRRLPRHGEDRDILERIYAVRLDCLRRSPECRAVLQSRDPQGLLESAAGDPESSMVGEPEETYGAGGSSAILPSDDELAAEEVAKRNPCGDFETFRPLFEGVRRDLKSGERQSVKYKDKTSRRITEPDDGPLFSGEEGDDDLPAGHIYVLRSLSEHPCGFSHRQDTKIAKEESGY